MYRNKTRGIGAVIKRVPIEPTQVAEGARIDMVIRESREPREPELKAEEPPHGFKRRDKPFVYIRSTVDRKPGELLRDDQKKAQRARKYKPEIVTDRILRRLLD